MITSHREARQYLVDYLRRDLIGPQSEDELLTDVPTTHYLTGILYPRDTATAPEEDDESDAVSETDDSLDVDVPQINATLPSAMGISFIVAGSSDAFRVKVSAAYYAQETSQADQTCTSPDTEIASMAQALADSTDGIISAAPDAGETKPGASGMAQMPKTPTKRWRRIPVGLNAGKSFSTPGLNHEMVCDGLELQVLVRSFGPDRLVTVTLVNKRTGKSASSGPETAEKCFFQPSIRVTSDPEGRPIFRAREPVYLGQADEDVELNRLLYRHALEYAVGHGCAVDWEPREGNHPTTIISHVIPLYEVPEVVAEKSYTGPALDMAWLANASGSDLERELGALVEEYGHWIDGIRTEMAGIDARYLDAARKNVERCEEAQDRMRGGLNLIVADGMARRAFQLACEAMRDQRRQTLIQKRKIQPGDQFEAQWRPFQIAFILMCLRSMTDPRDRYRDIVDLLWFPTGGGKTEAYLGLTAYAILLRRLQAAASGRPNEGAGTTVLMRYTLRLLTIQQFQRAATLICALEQVRQRDSSSLGTVPITVGLWVGGDTTPNTMKQAVKAVTELRAGKEVKKGNPRQIEICPWCGADLPVRGYVIPTPQDRLLIQCSEKTCPFHESPGLPVRVVDEDMYREPPSLLIGVVDKFAQLPWSSKVGRLFGRETLTMPPVLIIQDEMHLISGPLGTLVGLYESAIDLLTTYNGCGAKVIASTATIRRASDQTRDLFNREVRQFPPPGVDARDSFFAKAQPLDKHAGRLYLGVQAPGRSGKTIQLRIMAALLQAVYTMDAPSDIKDPYFTVVGYYNSLRELGGAVRLVEDDVTERIKQLARRESRQPREIAPAEELTSRRDSAEIPGLLDLMSRPMDDGAIDVLLATNMISVGVDVDRLSLMVVVGQPKTTAEYIQATSRVGRTYPGLVVTMYVASRPRDRSHYERFTAYHAAIYSQVEATSVTPFSARARDRGLHAVLFALVRHLVQGMSDDYAPYRLEQEQVQEHVLELTNRILRRVSDVDEGEIEATRKELGRVVERWQELVDLHGTRLRYGQGYGNTATDPFIMYSADKFAGLPTAVRQDNDDNELSYPTLNSLREVEPSCNVHFVKGTPHGAG